MINKNIKTYAILINDEDEVRFMGDWYFDHCFWDSIAIVDVSERCLPTHPYENKSVCRKWYHDLLSNQYTDIEVSNEDKIYDDDITEYREVEDLTGDEIVKWLNEHVQNDGIIFAWNRLFSSDRIIIYPFDFKDSDSEKRNNEKNIYKYTLDDIGDFKCVLDGDYVCYKRYYIDVVTGEDSYDDEDEIGEWHVFNAYSDHEEEFLKKLDFKTREEAQDFLQTLPIVAARESKELLKKLESNVDKIRGVISNFPSVRGGISEFDFDCAIEQLQKQVA